MLNSSPLDESNPVFDHLKKCQRKYEEEITEISGDMFDDFNMAVDSHQRRAQGLRSGIEILLKAGELTTTDYDFWHELLRLAGTTNDLRELARRAISDGDAEKAIRLAFMAGDYFHEWMKHLGEGNRPNEKLRQEQMVRIGEIAHKNLSDGNDARKQESIESARLVSAELLKRHKETGAKKKRIMQAMANDPTGQWGGLTTIKKHCQGVVLR